MENPWPGKIKCFQESYMIQKRMSELCFWSHSYLETRTIRLSQGELFLPTFLGKLVCVSALVPGVNVEFSHLTLLHPRLKEM